MHDKSIAERTKLKLQVDTRAMEHATAAKEMQSKTQRSAAEAAVKEAEVWLIFELKLYIHL